MGTTEELSRGGAAGYVPCSDEVVVGAGLVVRFGGWCSVGEVVRCRGLAQEAGERGRYGAARGEGLVRRRSRASASCGRSVSAPPARSTKIRLAARGGEFVDLEVGVLVSRVAEGLLHRPEEYQNPTAPWWMRR